MTDADIEQKILGFFKTATAAAIQTKIRDDPLFGGAQGTGVSADVAARIVSARPAGGFTSIHQIANISGVGTDAMHDILYTFWTETAPVSSVTSDLIAWKASRSPTFPPIPGSAYQALGTEVQFSLAAAATVLVEFGIDLAADYTGQRAPNYVLVAVSVNGATPADDDAIYFGGAFGEATAGFKSAIYGTNARLIAVALAAGSHKLALMGKRSGTGNDAAYHRGGWIKMSRSTASA